MFNFTCFLKIKLPFSIRSLSLCSTFLVCVHLFLSSCLLKLMPLCSHTNGQKSLAASWFVDPVLVLHCFNHLRWSHQSFQKILSWTMSCLSKETFLILLSLVGNIDNLGTFLCTDVHLDLFLINSLAMTASIARGSNKGNPLVRLLTVPMARGGNKGKPLVRLTNASMVEGATKATPSWGWQLNHQRRRKRQPLCQAGTWLKLQLPEGATKATPFTGLQLRQQLEGAHRYCSKWGDTNQQNGKEIMHLLNFCVAGMNQETFAKFYRILRIISTQDRTWLHSIFLFF